MKTRFVGSVLGFDYDIELESEEDFKSWLLAKIRRYQSGVIEIIDQLMFEAPTTAELKAKVADMEKRLAALEAKQQ